MTIIEQMRDYQNLLNYCQSRMNELIGIAELNNKPKTLQEIFEWGDKEKERIFAKCDADFTSLKMLQIGLINADTKEITNHIMNRNYIEEKSAWVRQFTSIPLGVYVKIKNEFINLPLAP